MSDSLKGLFPSFIIFNVVFPARALPNSLHSAPGIRVFLRRANFLNFVFHNSFSSASVRRTKFGIEESK